MKNLLIDLCITALTGFFATLGVAAALLLFSIGGGGSMAKTKRQPDIETIIEKAVNAGLAAGRREAEDIYKATEKRLYALRNCEERIR